jgi:outer membrane biogenesis lipoprotein LolB
MSRHLRIPHLSVLAVAAALMLGACSNQIPAPQPVAGQPLTWAQQHQAALQQAQIDHEERRGTRPCGLSGCF